MFWTILLILGSLVGFVYFLIKHMAQKSRSHFEKLGIPYLDSSSFFSNPDLIKMEFEKYKLLGNQPFGGVHEFGTPTVVIRDPELIKRVLIKDFESFVNRRDMPKSDPIFDNMMTNIEGQKWKMTRSLLSPAFTTGKIRRMFQLIDEISQEFVGHIRRQSVIDPDIDVKAHLNRATINVIASTAFGFKTNCMEDQNDPFLINARIITERSGALNFLRVFLFFMAPKVAKMIGLSLVDPNCTDFFRNAMIRAIKMRETSNVKRDDFVQLMIEARKGHLKAEPEEVKDAFDVDAELKEKAVVGEKDRENVLSEDLMISQSFLFFAAGFSTVVAALTFAIYELIVNPEYQDKLLDEINRELKGEKLHYEAIHRLDLMDRVISETLRKYPPAVRVERRAHTDYKIPDTDITLPKDTLVSVPSMCLHMDPEYFPNPEKFDPDRFLPEEKAKRSPYVYLPFGHGPRNCIGMRFALVEAKIILAHLIQNFRMEPAPKTKIPIEIIGPNGGPEAKGGIFVRFVQR